MSEIKVGDLVVCVTACCEQKGLENIGKVRVIVEIHTRESECSHCGNRTNGPHARATTSSFAGVPTTWLKRIPPLEKLDDVATGDLATQRRIHDAWAKV